jgi:hypothetical protein
MNTRFDARINDIKKATQLSGRLNLRPAIYIAAAIVSCLWFTSSSNGAQQTNMGQWLIESLPESSMVDMTLRYGATKKISGGQVFRNTNSFRVGLDHLQGLLNSQMASDGAQVKFQLVRDAGTFNCEGWFKGGRGAGDFAFTPNRNFISELSGRGIDKPTDEEQFYLAAHDVGLEFIDELRAQDYERPTSAQLVRLGTHGVRPTYIRELKGLGYQVKSVDLLIRMVDHGVSTNFVKDLAAAGYMKESPEQMIRAVDHGVSSSFLKEFSALVYEGVPLETLIRMIDHGVTPKFIRELEPLGYKRIPIDQLIRLRNAGVTPSYIQRLKNRGLNNLTVEELIRLRNQGVID